MDKEALAGPRRDEDYRALGAEGLYLGWFWRDYWDGNVSRVAADGDMMLDPARKWDYPDARMSDADTERVRNLLGQVGRLKFQILDIMETYRDKVRGEEAKIYKP